MWNNSRDELLHQTRWQRITTNFHRAIVEEPSWGKLLVGALMLYTLISLAFGSLVWELGAHDTRPSFTRVWYSMFLALFVSHVMEPENGAQMLVICFTTFVGAMLALLLFGVIYEKFSMNGPTVLFADKIMASRTGTDESTGRARWVLTFRMCASRGQRMLAPSVRLHLVARNAAGAVDNHKLELEHGMCDALAATPAAFYLRHYVGNDSPLLYLLEGDTCEGKERCGSSVVQALRLFGTVVGMDQVSLIDVAGHASWDPARDIVRGGTFVDMSLAMGSDRMDFCKLNRYTVAEAKGADAASQIPESRYS